jgi:hypothetical protein
MGGYQQKMRRHSFLPIHSGVAIICLFWKANVHLHIGIWCCSACFHSWCNHELPWQVWHSCWRARIEGETMSGHVGTGKFCNLLYTLQLHISFFLVLPFCSWVVVRSSVYQLLVYSWRSLLFCQYPLLLLSRSLLTFGVLCQLTLLFLIY